MQWSEKFMVRSDKKLKMDKIDPDCTWHCESKDWAAKEVAKLTERMKILQAELYAENRQSLLIVLQAMDAGGKDGTVNHVFAPLNPQGCRVQSFKVPSSLEAAHDFLWRVHAVVPKKGEVVIFNRSHYEDVLVTRVHGLVDKKECFERYNEINNFESLLARNNTRIVKFYLHISNDEQLARFIDRLDNPEKNWKISPNDYKERDYWNDYMTAFEDTLNNCSTEHAPWFVIPANHKYYRDLAIASIMVEVMESMKIKMPAPQVDIPSVRKVAVKELEEARKNFKKSKNGKEDKGQKDLERETINEN